MYPLGEIVPPGLNAINAFDVPVTYANDIKICIVDSGYDVNHIDLPSADKGNNVTGSTGKPESPWDQDGNGHGTHVAGTIAAIGGNDEGVVGIVRSGDANLHIVRVYGDDLMWAWKSNVINAVSVDKDDVGWVHPNIFIHYIIV